jgi:hypothetical protein
LLPSFVEFLVKRVKENRLKREILLNSKKGRELFWEKNGRG